MQAFLHCLFNLSDFVGEPGYLRQARIE